MMTVYTSISNSYVNETLNIFEARCYVIEFLNVLSVEAE